MENNQPKLTWHEKGKVTEITDKNIHLLPPELRKAIKVTRKKGRGFFNPNITNRCTKRIKSN